MNADVSSADYNDVKELLLIEGLRDWIQLAEIHSHFAFDHFTPKRSAAEAQQLTVELIREFVQEGLFVLGQPDNKRPSGFDPWAVPLDEAMAEIEHRYMANFDDRRNWQTWAWLALTEEGKALALQLYHADDV